MNLQTLETKSEQLIRRLEQAKQLEKEIEVLKGELVPIIKTMPAEDGKRWRIQFKAFEILLSTCPGKKNFDRAKAEEKFPELKSAEYEKQGNPYNQLSYSIKLQEES